MGIGDEKEDYSLVLLRCIHKILLVTFNLYGDTSILVEEINTSIRAVLYNLAPYFFKITAFMRFSSSRIIVILTIRCTFEKDLLNSTPHIFTGPNFFVKASSFQFFSYSNMK